MGPIHTQNSSTKSDSRPSTRSTESNACPSTAPAKSTSSDLQTSLPRQPPNTTGGKNSSVKRTRSPSPYKRPSKARKSLNFDSEPVPSKNLTKLGSGHAETQFDLLQLDGLSEKVTHNLSQEFQERSVDTNTTSDNNSCSNRLPLLSPDDLSSSAQLTRRSQRITLKKLEEGQSSLKTVEAGPGPTVTFNIPLVCRLPQTTDQSSDYGTASEHSFNHSHSQDPNKYSPRASQSLPSENETRYERRRRRSRGAVKGMKPAPSMSLSPDRLSGDECDFSSDDDGCLDLDISHSQPWDDDDLEDSSLALSRHRLPRGNNEWDRQIQQEEDLSQHSVSSEASFLALPTAALISATLVVYRKIYLLAPLEEYVLPSISSISTRSQSYLFSLDETGSRLCKRERRLLPAKFMSPFSMETHSNIIHEDSFVREFGLRITVASPVISLKPFGTKFAPTLPAVVSIPVDVDPAQGDEFFCLYSNNPSQSGTRPPSHFEWRVLVDENGNSKINYMDGRVSFEISEFGYLLIVIRNKYSDIEVTKKICARIGGKLLLPSEALDLVQVDFPKGSLETDITARAKLFFDTEMSWPDFFHKPTLDPLESALASPIIMVEPHGVKFKKVKSGDGNHGVTIQLPIPGYDCIMTNFAHLKPKLTIWQSCTSENEKCKWEILDTPYTISKTEHGNISGTVISFQVEHFSFFRVVWNIISSSLYEARVGMSYLYPYVSFSMKCQANMQENTDTKRFGLEVICYRSDKILPEVTNYPHRVGSCNKPKLVKPGKIIIRLKSKFFEQDVEAGEDDNDMVKEDCDFRGRDFEVQYALRFKEGVTVGRGTFGKVIVKRHVRQRDEEPLFEFNLQKYGCEGEQTPHDQNDRWSILALQELAGNLGITTDDNWKIFAKAIGFTRQEIKHKLKPAPDPFIAILNLYQARGGTPNEFVTALYSVNRQLKFGGGTSPAGSKKSISSQGSSGLGSAGDHFEESDSDTSGTQISQDSVLNGSMRKRSNPSINRSKGSGSANSKRAKRARIPIAKLAKPPKKKKDSSDENESDEDGSDDEDEKSIASDDEDVGAKALSDTTSLLHSRDLTKLECQYLWDVSAHLDTLNWRNLARTLGVDEPSIVNIEHLHKANGFRECAYQMLLFWKEKFPKQCTYGVLYQALCKEGMNAVAKKMRFVTRNDK